MKKKKKKIARFFHKIEMTRCAVLWERDKTVLRVSLGFNAFSLRAFVTNAFHRLNKDFRFPSIAPGDRSVRNENSSV